jgi:hypothetical protein
MFNLVKTTRAKYWHIKADIINETLCETKVTKNWKNKLVDHLPKNICKECLSYLDTPAHADNTSKHSSWE